MNNTHNNKHNEDGQMKDEIEGQQRIVLPVLTCLQK